jgi:predicted small lipoprotein YifL
MSGMMHQSKIVVNRPTTEFGSPTWGTTMLGLSRRMAWLASGVCLITSALSGCGQKGPLYLPTTQVSTPAAAPTNASSAPTP